MCCQSAAGSGSARVHKKTAHVPSAESESDFQNSLLPGILEHRLDSVGFLVITLKNLDHLKKEESSLRIASNFHSIVKNNFYFTLMSVSQLRQCFFLVLFCFGGDLKFSKVG